VPSPERINADPALSTYVGEPDGWFDILEQLMSTTGWKYQGAGLALVFPSVRESANALGR
jgi:hypothetical protein